MDDRLLIFGELFIKAVRDNTLFVTEGIIDGHMKSQVDREMHDKIKLMSPDDILLLKDFACRMIDLTMHNTLFMLEDNPDWVLSNQNAGVDNLNELSDGLSGELYTSDGWIGQFSNYPPSKGLEF